MDQKTRNAAIAAALILGGFGFVAFFMPTIMLSLGEVSPFLAALVAILFVLAFFGVFWLRGRAKRGD